MDPDDDVPEWTLLVKDLLIALGIVVVIVGGIFAVTRSWPPVVVVESGSMMHAGAGFGRVGTIDPGDLIFVQAVETRSDVVTHVEAEASDGPRTYGQPGEVIIFQGTQSTPIIHRAMAWVEVRQADSGELRYTVEGYGIRDARSITIEPLGLRDYQPHHAGYLTMGDSPRNPASDQALGIVTEPVRVDQVEGQAVGEVPWFGLIKLMVAGNACQQGWVRVLGACAPGDLWLMLGVGLGVVMAIPLAVDQAVLYLEEKEVALAPLAGEDGEDLSTDESSNRPGERP